MGIVQLIGNNHLNEMPNIGLVQTTSITTGQKSSKLDKCISVSMIKCNFPLDQTMNISSIVCFISQQQRIYVS